MMRLVLVAVAMTVGSAFVSPQPASRSAVTTKLNAYIPDGMSAAQWEAVKKKEADAKKKNLGNAGARGFKSRSMQSFVAALEKGEADHLFAVDPREVRKGKIPLKDVPYMQRGGSWDNSDLQGKKGWQTTGFGMRAFNDGNAEKKKENKYDAKYNGAKPEIGFFGISVDWNGKGGAADEKGVAARAKKNGINNDQQMWRDAGALSKADIAKRGAAPKLGDDKPEKKFFGLF